MYTTPIEFSRNLVKGRIAETLFIQMLREAGGFTILAFGYENILPELASRQKDIHAEETMEIIRRAPDFVIIDNESHEVHLVEVKYMKHMNSEYVIKAAKRMFASWKPSYLFIATPEGFFFQKVGTIVEQNGAIAPLSHTRITEKLQCEYIQLLNQFIEPKE
jgi:hypothetical protein